MKHQAKKLKTGFAIAVLAMLPLVTFSPVTSANVTETEFSNNIAAALKSNTVIQPGKKVNHKQVASILKIVATASQGNSSLAAEYAAIAATQSPKLAGAIAVMAANAAIEANATPSEALAILNKILSIDTVKAQANTINIVKSFIGTVNEANKATTGFTPITIDSVKTALTDTTVKNEISTAQTNGTDLTGVVNQTVIAKADELEAEVKALSDKAAELSAPGSVDPIIAELKAALEGCGDSDCRKDAATAAAEKVGSDPSAAAYVSAIVSLVPGAAEEVRKTVIADNAALKAAIITAALAAQQDDDVSPE